MSPMQLSCIGERKIQMHDWNSFTKFSSDARQLPMTHVLEVRTLHIYLSIIYIYIYMNPTLLKKSTSSQDQGHSSLCSVERERDDANL